MKDYPSERDCEHGHLRRKCQICAAESDYAELKGRYNALRAAATRLVVADDDLLKSWDAMANNGPLEDEYHAARAELARLLEPTP